MVSIQQTAVIVARRLGGYPVDFDGSPASINDLDTDAKLALTAGIGAEIRANPNDYTDAQVGTAVSMTGLSGSPLAYAGFSISDFVSETINNAEDLVIKPLVNVGKSASFVANALPLIAIGLGVIWLLSLKKKIETA